MQQTTMMMMMMMVCCIPTNEDDLELLELDQRYFINTAQTKFVSIVMVAKSNHEKESNLALHRSSILVEVSACL